MLVNGALADKPARLVARRRRRRRRRTAAALRRSRRREARRRARARFDIDVGGLAALDVGASTGGFTDCLLQRGARRVVALDVGHGQLHPRIRDDPRVVVLERTNIRDTTPDTIGGLVDVVVVDVSFISLTRGHPRARVAVPAWIADGAARQAAVRGRPGRGGRGRGVITDPAIHDRVRDEVDAALAPPAARSSAGSTRRSRAARATASSSCTP